MAMLPNSLATLTHRHTLTLSNHSLTAFSVSLTVTVVHYSPPFSISLSRNAHKHPNLLSLLLLAPIFRIASKEWAVCILEGKPKVHLTGEPKFI
ncbi:hypothetical protein PIB30_079756 [Stylosanthes scabra]|uniref:Uncharacterized protein n=1 Tax=Stylosanthes scabra TaxID=79078 RepID=A0ABU6UQS9_9FABA|nr:hypothetical protein [Stylosanthes scabra]